MTHILAQIQFHWMSVSGGNVAVIPSRDEEGGSEGMSF
jgi:hypothetical protein